jgi:hypothetical protein
MIRSLGPILTILASVVLLTSGISRADAPVLAGKLEKLLESSGYKSAAKVKEAVWTIDFSGKNLPKFKVVVSATENDKGGIFTALADPVGKNQLPRNRGKFDELLMKANSDFDYVKTGVDKDGDVFVRADIPPGADLASFKIIVEQVAAATDELYGKLKPLLR